MIQIKKLISFFTIIFLIGMYFETNCVRDDIGTGSMNDMRHAILGGNFSGGGRKGARTNAEQDAARLKLIEESNWTPLQNYINGFYPKGTDWFTSIQQLVEDGANINEQGKYGNTPLIEALLKISRLDNTLLDINDSQIYKIIDYLISKGANPNIENFKSETALDLAVVRAQWYIVLLLLNAGANLNYVNSNNQTVLDYLIDNERDMLGEFGFGWTKKDIENRIRHLKLLGAISNRSLEENMVYRTNDLIEHMALGHKLGDISVKNTPYGDATAALIKYIN
jgi:ankyrin repeat protein